MRTCPQTLSVDSTSRASIKITTQEYVKIYAAAVHQAWTVGNAVQNWCLKMDQNFVRYRLELESATARVCDNLIKFETWRMWIFARVVHTIEAKGRDHNISAAQLQRPVQLCVQCLCGKGKEKNVKEVGYIIENYVSRSLLTQIAFSIHSTTSTCNYLQQETFYY